MIKMNKHENIYSMKGIGKVYRFTILQTLKNKTYLLSLIMMIIFMGAIGPINYLLTNTQEKSMKEGDILNDLTSEKITILNETDIKFDQIAEDNFSDKEGGLKKEMITFYQAGEKSEDELINSLGKKDSLVVIKLGESGYKVSGIIGNDSEVKTNEINDITDLVNSQFLDARMKETGISEADIMKLSQGVKDEGAVLQSEYKDELGKTITGASYSTYMTGFSILIFLVITLSNSYVITSVTEEKQSKLAENILVSVRPMALLMGKIFGMLTYVFMILVGGLLATKASNLIMENVFNIDLSKINNGGIINMSLISDSGVLTTIIVVVTIIFGVLSFSVLGGIFGSACSKPEDTQNATGSVMMIAMVGYFASFMLGTVDKDVWNMVLTYIPPFSYYSMPVMYATGRIGLPEVGLSLAIQLAVLVVVTMLCAKTYRTLVLSDSSTPKFMTIIKSLKA